jgi:hypothetical protein
VTDAKRLLDLNREAGEQVPQRVLQREAEHHRADRRRCQNLFLHEQDGRQREHPDDNRVLNDGGELLGHAVLAPWVDREDDEDVDDAECDEERVDGPNLVDDRRRERCVPDQCRRRRRGRKEETGGEELPVHPPAGTRPPEDERGQQ